MKKTLVALAFSILVSGAVSAQDNMKKSKMMHDSTKTAGKMHKSTMKMHHKTTKKKTVTPN